jgi:myo-inositol 2-dehydrogenase/D-chiro-inositol 1-dehydrogenase
MRLGLIGLGRIGAFHARTLVGLDAVDSLVVTDAVADTTARVAAGLRGQDADVEAVESPAKLLAAGVDGVVIAAATDAHAELLAAAVDAGLPAFCEKPLAGRIDDAVVLARHLDGRDERVQIGYPRRFDAGHTTARAAVRGGELGWLHTVRATTLDPAPPPPDYVRASGGIFRDCSVHDFDAIRWVTGREVVEVYAVGANRGDRLESAEFAEAGDVDTVTTTLTLDDDTLAVVSNTRYNGRGYDVRLELHGSRDSVAVGWDAQTPLRSVEPGVGFPGGRPYGFFMDRLAAAFRAELAAFTELVAGTRESPCTVADAMAAGWIAEAATMSRREHRPVRIDEVRIDEVRIDEVRIDEVRIDEARIDEARIEVTRR